MSANARSEVPYRVVAPDIDGASLDSAQLEFAGRTAGELVQRAFASIERIPVADREFFGRIARYMASRTR